MVSPWRGPPTDDTAATLPAGSTASGSAARLPRYPPADAATVKLPRELPGGCSIARPPSAARAANAYLRQQTSGFRGRHFQIFVEPLAAPNQVHSRSYGNEYTIVVTPSAAPRVAEVRQAYLYYLLDPLATRNEEILNRKKPLAEQAQRARTLGDAYKQDFLLLTTGSLVRAVQARMDRSEEHTS